MAGIRSMGCTLTLSGVGSEADVVLSNVASIGAIKTQTDEIDVTTLDSPNGAKEFIQGAKDSGEFDVELNNVFDGQAATLNSVFAAGATRSWILTFKDGATTAATLGFDAFIKGREFGELTTEGLDKVTITLRVTGAPVYAEV